MKTPAGITPHRFLRELGIVKQPILETGSDEYLNEVARAGIDRNAIRNSDPFSAECNDALFANEIVARATLSHDFDRLRELMEDWDKLSGLPKAPRRIAEIGGAAGILSLFLARRHPDAIVTVYDFAERPLAVGRKWANELSIQNVEFLRKSYEEIAAGGGAAENDLVLSYYGFPFETDPASGEQTGFLCRDLCREPIEPPPEMAVASMAISRLLADHGVGVVRGAWRERGAVNLFEALHRAGLGVDWNFSFTGGMIANNIYTTNKGYLFVGRHIPRIARDSWEEARGFFACGELETAKLAFSTGAAESFTALFDNGEQLLSAEASWKTGGTERVRLLYKVGMLLLEHTSTLGMRKVKLESLSGIARLLQLADAVVRGWRERGADLRQLSASPQLGNLADYASLIRRTPD
jgi:hypothetical protein